MTYDGLDRSLWNESGATFEVSVQEPGGVEQYHYPQDLPQNGPGPEKGPNCRGLPVVKNNEDSLSDYTAGPQSLNQRTTDNSPRLATQPGQALPSIGSNPAQQFFGPNTALPLSSLDKAGK